MINWQPTAVYCGALNRLRCKEKSSIHGIVSGEIQTVVQFNLVRIAVPIHPVVTSPVLLR